MTDKVAPVAIAMKPLNHDVVVEENLRCKKCQLVVPCSCTSNSVMLSEIQVLEFELNEKQEIAAETVRGMASKRKSSASAPDSSSETTFTPPKPDAFKTFEKIMTDAGKIASSDFNSRWRFRSKGLFQASADNKLALKLYGNKAAVIMEQRRQAQKGEGVIHPFSTFRWYWDIVMVVLITTHVLLLPVGIAFVETDYSTSWLAFNCISDAIFMVDIFLSFRTGIIDFNRQEEVILDKQYIRRRYLRGWFAIDVLSSLPFDYVYLIASSGSSGGDQHSEIVQASRILRILKLTKLLSLLKLLRVSRIVRYIKELEELLNIQSGQMRIVKLIGCMLLLSHWNGCVQFLIPRLQDFPDDSWVSINGLKDKPNFEQYSWSLFNAMSHMLCIGYGRFPPHSVTELWVTLCSMTFGATFYAVFIGMMSTLIMSIDSSGRLYKEKLNQVGEYMRYRKIPLQLRRRIQDYYEHRYHHKLFDEDAILRELSFPLREEIQIHNARSLLTSVPFFSDAGEDFIARAVSILKFEVFLPGEFICKRGRQADKMYFIVRGIVDVLTTDGFVATSLTDGSHFGEISLLRKGDNRRVASCRAATMLDLYSLTASHFNALLKEFPEIHAVLEEVAAERLSRLEKYSDEARMHQIKRNYKTEQVTSIDSDETERSKKRLGALKIPTLTKGFLGSLTPTLVASLESGTEKKNEDTTTQKRDLQNIEEEGQGSSNEQDTNDKESESNMDIEIKNTLADL